MTPLSSSNLAGADYDGATRVLTIEFTNGAVYEYEGVPAEVFADLLGSSSPGSYFYRQIKGRFPYQRVT